MSRIQALIASLLLVLGLTVFSKSFAADNVTNATPDPTLTNYSGPVISIPDAQEQPTSLNLPVKALFSIVVPPKDANTIAPGLSLAARVTQLYKVAGLDPHKLDLEVVVSAHAT